MKIGSLIMFFLPWQVFPSLSRSYPLWQEHFGSPWTMAQTCWQPVAVALQLKIAEEKNKGISELNTTCNKGLAFPEEYSRCTGVSNPIWKGFFYLRMQTVLSLGSTWNPSKHVQFRPPGKFEQLCMQSLKSTHSLISEKQIIQHKLLVSITAIWQTFVSRNILAESYININ